MLGVIGYVMRLLVQKLSDWRMLYKSILSSWIHKTFTRCFPFVRSWFYTDILPNAGYCSMYLLEAQKRTTYLAKACPKDTLCICDIRFNWPVLVHIKAEVRVWVPFHFKDTDVLGLRPLSLHPVTRGSHNTSRSHPFAIFNQWVLLLPSSEHGAEDAIGSLAKLYGILDVLPRLGRVWQKKWLQPQIFPFLFNYSHRFFGLRLFYSTSMARDASYQTLMLWFVPNSVYFANCLNTRLRGKNSNLIATSACIKLKLETASVVGEWWPSCLRRGCY